MTDADQPDMTELAQSPVRLMLLPYPQRVEPALVELESETGPADTVLWASATDPRVAQRLAELLPQGVGRPLTLEVDQIDPGYPQLGLDESYRLVFSAAGVVLQAPTTWGALHGVTSLWQLHVASTLPVSGVIADHPRFAWRGVLIDVARHFLPMALLYRVVDAIARLKLNVLHLHLTDDQGFRLQSSAYPQLASAESYSPAQLRGLIEFAACLGVRVVPELDVPGHVNSWLEKYPEWGLAEVAPTRKFGVHEACLNVTDATVYTALQSLFSEVAALFPDDHVHIGGDEVHPAWWSADAQVQAYMRQHGLADVRALQAHFNQRLCAMLGAMGKQVVAWDEVLHEQMPELIVQNWRGATTRDRALAAGQDCVVSAPYYLDLFYPAELHYKFDPQAPQQRLLAAEDAMRDDLRLQHVAQGLAWTDQWRNEAIDLDATNSGHGRVLGGEACLWSELVDAQTLEVRLFSRLPAVAERLWSAADVDDVDDFYRRLAQVVEMPGIQMSALQQTRLTALGLTEQQIEAAAYLEPVKWYARLLGAEALQARLRGQEMPQARPYQTHTPLNRVVDFIAPESFAARGLLLLRATQLRKLCRSWRALDANAWPQDVQAAISGLHRVGELLEILLAQAPQQLPELDEVREELLDIYQPRGEYMVAVVPWLLSWLELWRTGER